jgi:hypothetical protein
MAGNQLRTFTQLKSNLAGNQLFRDAPIIVSQNEGQTWLGINLCTHYIFSELRSNLAGINLLRWAHNIFTQLHKVKLDWESTFSRCAHNIFTELRSNLAGKQLFRDAPIIFSQNYIRSKLSMNQHF